MEHGGCSGGGCRLGGEEALTPGGGCWEEGEYGRENRLRCLITLAIVPLIYNLVGGSALLSCLNIFIAGACYRWEGEQETWEEEEERKYLEAAISC